MATSNSSCICLAEIVKFLESSAQESNDLIDVLLAWVSSTNVKVVIGGLQVITCLAGKMETEFSRHVNTILPAVVDHLGDSCDEVRSLARDLLLKLMLQAGSFEFVIQRMMSLGFTHKVSRVRVEILVCLQRALSEFGAKSMTLSKVVPFIVNMLDDTNHAVKEQAANTLIVIHQHVGERLRDDLCKKDIHPSKLALLFVRKDEHSDWTSFLDTCAEEDQGRVNRSSCDGEDSSSTVGGMSLSGATLSSTITVGSNLDEEAFTAMFEQVPVTKICSARELTERIGVIRRHMLCDWKRIEMLKELRSLFFAGATEYPDFLSSHLPSLKSCIELSARDLRSQVVREACITIAFMARELGHEFADFAEFILPTLTLLVQSSEPIVATSGLMAVRFIIKFTHSPNLIPKLASIFKQCSECILLMVQVWPIAILKKHVATLQDAIKRGIGDSDAKVRKNSEMALQGFAQRYVLSQDVEDDDIAAMPTPASSSAMLQEALSELCEQL